MKRQEIKNIFEKSKNYYNKEINIFGWIKSIRCSKKIGFIMLNDGSIINSLQVVFSYEILNFENISKLGIGSSINVIGTLISTPNQKQNFEIKASKIFINGESPSDYPLQKKKHSMEFLRTIAHLRPRTNTFSAVFRIRSAASFAIHKFLHEEGFFYIHTPIITTSDCEGAGEVFTVTTLDLKNKENRSYSQDFFGKHAMLTVSGQLQAECVSMALSKVYTFGPTFRAENSNTTRHAAEFWMLEPEIVFSNLSDIIELSSKLIKYIINYVLNFCEADLEFLSKTYDENLMNRLKNISKVEFDIITYTEAVDLLLKSNHNFEYKVNWGSDLQTEHEKYLTEIIFNKPIFVTDYPKDIKAFYMRQNDDKKTVSATDMLFPGIGEMIGGSVREERYNILLERIKKLGFKEEDYWWYLDLRKYGTVKHGGFGLGFERLIMFLTSISNIRDVMPFPRTVNKAEF